MEDDYARMLIKKLNERRALYSLLLSERRLRGRTEIVIKDLEKQLSDLDNALCVLVPKH